jgi:hypothetical protein
LNIGAYAEINQLIAGLSYRHSNQIGDALIFSAGARMGYFKIAYSFDFTVSDLSVTQGGAHELGIIYNLGEGFRDPVDIQDCLNIFR